MQVGKMFKLPSWHCTRDRSGERDYRYATLPRTTRSFRRATKDARFRFTRSLRVLTSSAILIGQYQPLDLLSSPLLLHSTSDIFACHCLILKRRFCLDQNILVRLRIHYAPPNRNIASITQHISVFRFENPDTSISLPIAHKLGGEASYTPYTLSSCFSHFTIVPLNLSAAKTVGRDLAEDVHSSMYGSRVHLECL